MAGAGRAQAQSPEPPLWPEGAREVGTPDLLVTGLALSSMALLRVPNRRAQPWMKTTRLDDRARKGLRGASVSARTRAAHVSDALIYSAAAYPVLVDALLLAGVKHRSWKTTWQLTLMGAEAMLLNAALTKVTKHLTWRTRPYALEGCQADGSCGQQGGSRNHSFFSGHSSLAATAAGLSCMFHARVELHEDRRWSAATCGMLSTAAVTTGILRVVADRHHLTDVISGLAVGFAVGAAVPALHLPRRRRTQLSLQASAGGLALTGRF